MLQRIQTAYLLLITVLTVLMMFLPLGLIRQGHEFFKYDVSGIMSAAGDKELIYPTWGLFALTAIIALVAVITIFLYKNRILQIRLCIFNAILMVSFYVLFTFFYFNYKDAVGVSDISMNLKFALSFPLINLILDYIAIRNIGADEALVRSLERLR